MPKGLQPQAKSVKPIARDKYEAMVRVARREDPSTGESFFRKLADAAGTRVGTARQAWRTGWPTRELPPIRDLLLEDDVALRSGRYLHGDVGGLEARIDAARIESSARERLDAYKSRVEEFVLVRHTRLAATQLLIQTRQLIAAHGELVAAALHKLPQLVEQLREGPLTLGRFNAVATTSERLVRSTARLASATHDVIRVERLLVGQPTEIVETQSAPSERPIMAMKPEQVEQYLQDELDAFRRAEDRERTH